MNLLPVFGDAEVLMVSDVGRVMSRHWWGVWLLQPFICILREWPSPSCLELVEVRVPSIRDGCIMPVLFLHLSAWPTEKRSATWGMERRWSCCMSCMRYVSWTWNSRWWLTRREVFWRCDIVGGVWWTVKCQIDTRAFWLPSVMHI